MKTVNKLVNKFKSFNLFSRVWVAIFCIPLLAGSNYLGFYAVLILWTVIWLYMLQELCQIIGLKEHGKDNTLFLGVILFLVISRLMLFSEYSFLVFLIVSIIYPISLSVILFWSRKKNIFVYLSYIVYVTLPILFLWFIHQEQGPNAILLILVTLWSMDSFSYFTGIAIGKHPVAPKISGKKTIEGTIGGILGSSLVFYFLHQTLNISLNNFHSFLFPVLLTSSAFLGDLFESFIKRQFNYKDSGTVLRGHGGMLDRFDSLLFLVYIWFLMVIL